MTVASSGTAASAKLTLGPVLFNWPTPMWVDFYARIADEAPVDRVVVGEAVCSKRTPFRTDVISDTIERLQRGGKEVVLSTLALPTLKREIAEILDTADGEHLVEVNDVTALAAVAGRRHVVGPLVNVYNEDTLAELATLGATTVCLPPELPLSSIAVLASRRGAVELEIFAFGRAPLAISARCYHARAHDLAKDACKFVCEVDADGLEVETLDGQRFLAINGVQTLASGCTVLGGEIADLAAAGVTRFRLSPHTCDMVAVTRTYRDLLDGRIDAAGLAAAVGKLPIPGHAVNGYLHGRPGDVHVL